MAKTIYPQGVLLFKPHANAPDFVKGTLIIAMNKLIKFGQENPDYLTEYNGEKQLKMQILDGNDGLYLTVDTWKPGQSSSADTSTADDEPLPF